MQAIMETIFDIGYLGAVIILGALMIKNCRGDRQFYLFGIMGVILGVGDAFHLVPRILALHAGDMESYAAALGIGKMISSITTAVYYTLLYMVWRIRYHITDKNELTIAVYAMLALRIVLCLLPFNQWTSLDAPLSWGIYRNIPFVILGVILMVILYQSAKKENDTAFQWMWLTVVISFVCYIPVVLFAETIPAVGMLMLPKACAYVWAVAMGYRAMKQKQVLSGYLDRFKVIR
jgi:hypothetical protein